MHYNVILEALKAKFDGVGDSILSKMAKKLEVSAKTEDEAKTAAEAVTFQQLLDMYGDSRATDATKTAVLNYEKKHNIKDGKPVEKEPEPTTEPKPDNGGEPVPEWAKALIESNKALTEKVKAMSAEKITTERRQQLDKIIGTLPEGLRKGYDRIALDTMEDEAFANLLTEVGAEVEEIGKSINMKGALFTRPKEGGGGGTQPQEASDEDVEKVLSGMGL